MERIIFYFTTVHVDGASCSSSRWSYCGMIFFFFSGFTALLV
jgi:hypothetical protein